jgi:hypothetical protein
MTYRVKWNGKYVRNLARVSAYTSDRAEAKKWRTRRGVDRWLRLKDRLYAADCTVEETVD